MRTCGERREKVGEKVGENGREEMGVEEMGRGEGGQMRDEWWRYGGETDEKRIENTDMRTEETRREVASQSRSEREQERSIERAQ